MYSDFNVDDFKTKIEQYNFDFNFGDFFFISKKKKNE